MKGIVLAGGNGTRLYPLTHAVSKQLLPVYDKPMIYYPLSVLMLAGIRDILIISTPDDLPHFRKMFGDGNHLGVSLSYMEQPRPEGIAQAFVLAETFIGQDDVTLILGDNIFYGDGLTRLLEDAIKNNKGATIFGYSVDHPERFGVIDFDDSGHVTAITEKPDNPPSHYAVAGLYMYDARVVDFAKRLTPSHRGELEISDINQMYLNDDDLHVELLGRGFAWLDTGTHEALLEASQFISVIEKRQNLKIACLEEIAYRKGYITQEALRSLAESYRRSSYGQYLLHKMMSL